MITINKLSRVARQILFSLPLWGGLGWVFSFPLLAVLGWGLLTSCSDDIDLEIPYPTNITFEELNIPTRFSHVVPDGGGFSSGGLNFNTKKAADGQLAGGFCYSNRSNRSFTWSGDTESVDSMRYSVFTLAPNNTGNYLVAHAIDQEAFFTLDNPSVIEYMLVANTTWVYLPSYYGDPYNGANPYVPSAPRGLWHAYIPGGVKKMTWYDYFTLTATGYRNGQVTGTAKAYLANKWADGTKLNYISYGWRKFDMSSLGEVDKVVFTLDSSDKDAAGNMRTPAWFCIDGIQLKQ